MKNDKNIQQETRKVFFKIIIPNYNNGHFLEKCLDSVRKQTFSNYVCIVVDDLSTDNSFQIIKKYSDQSPKNFISIQLDKKRYGGGARNEGIDYPIDSEYTWFIDSDDWLYDENVLKRIYDTVINNNFPDLITCSFQRIKMKSNKKIFETIHESDNFYSIIRRGFAPWRFCYRSSIKCRFTENVVAVDDIIHALELFDEIDEKKISTIYEPCYCYNQISENSYWNLCNDKIKLKKREESSEHVIGILSNKQFHNDLIQKFVDEKFPTARRKK